MVTDRDRIRTEVHETVGRLSVHASRRYGLPPRSARIAVARTLSDIADLIRMSPGFIVSRRLLLSVLHRHALSTLSSLASARPELHRLCRLAEASRERRTSATHRRAAWRLARRERIEDGPTERTEDLLRVLLESLDAASPDEDWMNAVLAPLAPVDDAPVTPWVHPPAGSRSAGSHT